MSVLILTPYVHLSTHSSEENFMQKRDLLDIPSYLMKKLCLLVFLEFIAILLIDATSFFLQFSKEAISNKKVILSLVFISIYYLKTPFNRFVNSFITDYSDLLQEEKDVVINGRSCEALFRVKDKVLHLNEEHGYQEKMPSSEILSTLITYIQEDWAKRIFFIRNLPQIVSSLVMFLGLIFTSTLEVKNTIAFTGILILSTVIEFVFSNYKCKINKSFEEDGRKARNVKNEAEQNVLNIKSYFDAQAKFRTDEFVKACTRVLRVRKNQTRAHRKIELKRNFSCSIFTVMVLFLKISETGIQNTTLETLIGAITLVTIFERFLFKLNDFYFMRINYEDTKNKLEVNQPHFNKIYDAYCYEIRNEELPLAKVKSITIQPFSFTFKNPTEKNPFSLHSVEEFHFSPGDFVILTGDSGSGKSTFMKILTDELHFSDIDIKIETDLEGRVASIFQTNDSTLGSKSVLEEITLGKVNFDKDKLLQILKVLHLYEELQPRCEDIFHYLSNVGFEQFSDGQQQRLTLACSLFNIDEHHQVIALDEITNNLNHQLTLQVLQYIKESCRDRIVLCATHQIEQAIQVANKRLEFVKSCDSNYCYLTPAS